MKTVLLAVVVAGTNPTTNCETSKIKEWDDLKSVCLTVLNEAYPWGIVSVAERKRMEHKPTTEEDPNLNMHLP